MRHVPVMAAAIAALVTRSAAAQESAAEIARRELITQAEQASDHGDHAQALALAMRAATMRMTPSLRLLLAQEHQSLGHTLDALDAAGRCAREADDDAALRNRDRILTACRALLGTLGRHVARVTVRLETPVQGARVEVAGRPLDAALVGVAVPVMPGRVIITTLADGYQTFRREFDLAAGAEQVIPVTLVAVAATPAAATVTHAPVATSRGAGPMPWIVMGAGALTLGAGVGFWLLQEDALSSRDTARQRALAEGYDSTAHTWNLAANIAWGVGAAMVIGGGVWWLVGRGRGDNRAQAWHVGAAPLASGALLTVDGRL